MTVFRCGTKTITELGKIEGIITGITIRFNKVQYEISYFYNGKFENIWLDECEFKVQEIKHQKIGFK